jgi:hypothetical protein
VFNLYDSDKLAEWKNFRDSLETSNDPLQDVVNLWIKAPFRSSYLNPTKPDEWPDPWTLILNSDLDDLAISLGMLYTIKLTQRFNESKCEIHTLTSESKEPKYFVVVDDEYVLNFNYGEVSGLDAIDSFQTSMIWSMQDRI